MARWVGPSSLRLLPGPLAAGAAVPLQGLPSWLNAGPGHLELRPGPGLGQGWALVSLRLPVALARVPLRLARALLA